MTAETLQTVQTWLVVFAFSFCGKFWLIYGVWTSRGLSHFGCMLHVRTLSLRLKEQSFSCFRLTRLTNDTGVWKKSVIYNWKTLISEQTQIIWVRSSPWFEFELLSFGQMEFTCTEWHWGCTGWSENWVNQIHRSAQITFSLLSLTAGRPGES